jgi:hypothetical protein
MEPTNHFSYDEYDRLTRVYSNEHGGVNYSGLKNEITGLKDFIDLLAATPSARSGDGAAARMQLLVARLWEKVIPQSDRKKFNFLNTRIDPSFLRFVPGEPNVGQAVD